jgi:hypothetical protein
MTARCFYLQHQPNELYPDKYIENRLSCPMLNLKSGWLSGFIDAEGCFYASISAHSSGK